MSPLLFSARSKSPRVAIVVLNWNNWTDTIECLASLRNLEFRNWTLFVVDNGSQNNSKEQIKDWARTRGTRVISLDLKEASFPVNVRSGSEMNDSVIRPFFLLGLEQNLGYAGGNNVAIAAALSMDFDYIWILNNDTIVASDSLTELVKCAEKDGSVGLVASQMVHAMDDQPFPPKEQCFEDRCVESLSVGGGSILFRANCIRDIGLIDEQYFCYYEDFDMSFRARHKGWKLFRNYRSVVFHKWGSAAGSRRTVKRFLWKKVVRIGWEGFLIPGYYEARNGLYFYKKNRPFLFLLYAIARTLHLFLQIVLYDDHKWGRLKIIARGTWDGLIGRMGKAEIP